MIDSGSVLGEQFVSRHPERPHVAAWVRDRGAVAELLGTHVGEGADDLVGARLQGHITFREARDAEVQDARAWPGAAGFDG